MPITTLTINGIPVENYGLGVIGLDGWLDVAARNFSPVQAPMRPGLIPVSVGSTIDARTIGLKFYHQPASLADRRQKLSDLRGAFGGTLEIATVEDPTRVCYGYLTDVKSSLGAPVLSIPNIESDLTITCFDPLWYDREPRLYGGNAAGNWVSIDTGGAPMRRLKYWITGAAANPLVRLYRTQNTMEVARMQFTVTLGANDGLEVDCDACTITKWTAGVASSALSSLDPTHDFFVVDEAPYVFTDGNMILTTSAGALTACYYRSFWA